MQLALSQTRLVYNENIASRWNIGCGWDDGKKGENASTERRRNESYQRMSGTRRYYPSVKLTIAFRFRAIITIKSSQREHDETGFVLHWVRTTDANWWHRRQYDTARKNYEAAKKQSGKRRKIRIRYMKSSWTVSVISLHDCPRHPPR